MERRWREADDHPHGEKSRWKEAIVVQCGWTRQGVVRDEAGSEISWGSMNKAKKSELSQHPCLTEEKLRTTERK